MTYNTAIGPQTTYRIRALVGASCCAAIEPAFKLRSTSATPPLLFSRLRAHTRVWEALRYIVATTCDGTLKMLGCATHFSLLYALFSSLPLG